MSAPTLSALRTAEFIARQPICHGLDAKSLDVFIASLAPHIDRLMHAAETLAALKACEARLAHHDSQSAPECLQARDVIAKLEART